VSVLDGGGSEVLKSRPTSIPGVRRVEGRTVRVAPSPWLARPDGSSLGATCCLRVVARSAGAGQFIQRGEGFAASTDSVVMVHDCRDHDPPDSLAWLAQGIAPKLDEAEPPPLSGAVGPLSHLFGFYWNGLVGEPFRPIEPDTGHPPQHDPSSKPS
jgi:hypothetical protein